MNEITIYTDGACSGNPGKGGWGAVLLYQNSEKYLSGSEKLTTNNNNGRWNYKTNWNSQRNL